MAGTALTFALLGASAQAASSTWLGAGLDDLWSNVDNWQGASIAGGTVPTSGNQDTATFNNAPLQTTVGVDLNRNLKIINFATGAGSFTIGDAGPNAGNALYLSANGSTGTIKILSTVTGTGLTEKINAPLFLQPSVANGTETYAMSNDSADSTNVLNIGGSITAVASTSAGILNFTGANTGNNVASGDITGTGTSTFAVNKGGAGTWTLSGTILTKGTGVSGGMAMTGGTISLTNTATFTGKVTVNSTDVAGGTSVLNISGNVALGTGAADYITIGDGSGGTMNVTAGTTTLTPSTSKAFVIGTLDAGGAGTGTVNVSGGTVRLTNAAPIRFGSWDGTTTRMGAGILNLSNTGVFDTGTTGGGIALGIGNGTSSGTINLDGGTLQTMRNITKGPGSATFNFNGGTLLATGNNATLIAASVTTNIKAGGATVDTNGFSVSLLAPLQGDAVSTGGGLTKKGNGTLTLTGAATYTGVTNINTGTLALAASGSLSGSAQISLASGATFNASAVPGGYMIPSTQTLVANGTVTGDVLVDGVLGGTGTINGAVNVDIAGKISPGAATLDVNGPITFSPEGVLALSLTGASPGDGAGFYGQVNMTSNAGAISIFGGKLSLSLSGFTPSAANTFFIFTRADSNPFSTFFDSADEGAMVDLGSGYSGQITYAANWTGTQAGSTLTGGNDVAIYNIVPEPASAVLLLGGMGALVALGRPRRPQRFK